MTAPALQARGLTKRYPGGKEPSVREVDLTVGDGEVAALVGESGSGKTTVLRLVAGLEVPDAGEVRVAGRTVAGPGVWVPPERRGVGLVFQSFALFPHMTVRENVAFGLHDLARGERRRRAETMLERVGLGGLGERYPHQLSGGQRQRVALARSLAPEPGLLLLDEPFSNLDQPLKAELRETVAEALERAGVPALLVVHDAEDVFVLADRVHVMREGRVLQSGAPEDLYEHPAHLHVARFFGEFTLLPTRSGAGGLETPLGRVPGPVGVTTPAVALVRPEHVRLSDRPDEGAAAVVRDVRIQQGRLRVTLVLDVGEAAGAAVTAMTGSDHSLGRGDRVYVSARPDEIQILPEGVERDGAGNETPPPS